MEFEVILNDFKTGLDLSFKFTKAERIDLHLKNLNLLYGSENEYIPPSSNKSIENVSVDDIIEMNVLQGDNGLNKAEGYIFWNKNFIDDKINNLA